MFGMDHILEGCNLFAELEVFFFFSSCPSLYETGVLFWESGVWFPSRFVHDWELEKKMLGSHSIFGLGMGNGPVGLSKERHDG